MRRPLRQRTCKPCQTCFDPHPRSAGRQRSCSTPACRHASTATSQRRWLHQPAHRDDFTGPPQVERVRQWRKAHPGSWRRHAARPAEAFQDAFTPPPFAPQPEANDGKPEAFQDAVCTPPAVVVGLLAHCTGLT